MIRKSSVVADSASREIFVPSTTSSPEGKELKKEWVFWFFRVNFHGVGMRYFPDELVGNALGFFPKFTILVKFGGGSVITGRLIKCFDFYEISFL